jgi:hypothetical protein
MPPVRHAATPRASATSAPGSLVAFFRVRLRAVAVTLDAGNQALVARLALETTVAGTATFPADDLAAEFAKNPLHAASRRRPRQPRRQLPRNLRAARPASRCSSPAARVGLDPAPAPRPRHAAGRLERTVAVAR